MALQALVAAVMLLALPATLSMQPFDWHPLGAGTPAQVAGWPHSEQPGMGVVTHEPVAGEHALLVQTLEFEQATWVYTHPLLGEQEEVWQRSGLVHVMGV